MQHYNKWHYGLGHVVPLATLLIVAIIGAAYANGGAGDASKINDITMSMDEMQERGDSAWAMKHAAEMAYEDNVYCKSLQNVNPITKEPEYPARYAQCMHRRQMTRTLFLLKRGCLGVRAASC